MDRKDKLDVEATKTENGGVYTVDFSTRSPFPLCRIVIISSNIPTESSSVYGMQPIIRPSLYGMSTCRPTSGLASRQTTTNDLDSLTRLHDGREASCSSRAMASKDRSHPANLYTSFFRLDGPFGSKAPGANVEPAAVPGGYIPDTFAIPRAALARSRSSGARSGPNDLRSTVRLSRGCRPGRAVDAASEAVCSVHFYAPT